MSKLSQRVIMLAAAPGSLLLRDSRLASVWDKVRNGVRLSREDGQLLFETEDLDCLWRRWKIEPREALTQLTKTGLDSMPGGGAEIFSKRLQKELHYSGKADADR